MIMGLFNLFLKWIHVEGFFLDTDVILILLFAVYPEFIHWHYLYCWHLFSMHPILVYLQCLLVLQWGVGDLLVVLVLANTAYCSVAVVALLLSGLLLLQYCYCYGYVDMVSVGIWVCLFAVIFGFCSFIPSTRVQDKFLDSIMDSITMDPSLDGSYILTITNGFSVMFVFAGLRRRRRSR